MNRCSSHHAPGLVSRGRIAGDLREMGVEAGDAVMVHAAVGAIGWIVGGPDQVLHGLLDAVGEQGTVMAYTGWDGSPYDVTIGAAELPPQLLEAWPPYDPAMARAVRSWGVLPEILRTWPGAERSAHPDSSFAAVGVRARELVGEHPLQYGMGARSPLEALCKAHGKVLLLGAPLAHVTLLHYAEHVADVPGKEIVRYWAPILVDGAKQWVEIEEFSTEGCLPWRGAADLFETIVKEYLKEGRGVAGRVGAAPSYLFDAADLAQYGIEWIEQRFTEPAEEPGAIEIRPAEAADHRELVRLLGGLEEEATGSIPSESRRSSRADDLIERAERGVFVAQAGNDVVGMIAVRQEASERGEIELAYVDPAERRRGILRELEIDASAHLRDAGCCRVRLRVPAENRVARGAWRALGYAPTEEILERPL